MPAESVRQNLGTCVIVVNQNNEVLLGKRLCKVSFGNFGLPGGGVEIGESPVDSAVRETAEETTLRLSNPILLAIILDHQDPPTGDYLHFAVLSTGFTGSPALTEPDKCSGWDWYPLDRLPSPIVPAHLAALNYFGSCKNTPRLGFLEISFKS